MIIIIVCLQLLAILMPIFSEFFKTIDAQSGSAGGFLSVLYRKVSFLIPFSYP